MFAFSMEMHTYSVGNLNMSLLHECHDLVVFGVEGGNKDLGTQTVTPVIGHSIFHTS